MTLYYIENLSFCVYLFMNLWSKSYSFYLDVKSSNQSLGVRWAAQNWHRTLKILLFLHAILIVINGAIIKYLNELEVHFRHLRLSLKPIGYCVKSLKLHSQCYYYDISSPKIWAIKYRHIHMPVFKSQINFITFQMNLVYCNSALSVIGYSIIQLRSKKNNNLNS